MEIKPHTIKSAIIVFLLLIAFPIVSYAQTVIHSADFETDLDGWTQDTTGDDFEWTRYSGGTTSSSTGPSTGASGSFYMYTEASSNSNKTANFVSPSFDLTSVTSPLFTFYYHMYGSDMGSLYVDISTDGAATFPTNIWSASGDLGNVWNSTTLDLSAFIGQTINIRFRGVTGNNYRSDIAIDNVSLTVTYSIGPEINVLGNGVSIIGDGTNTPDISNDTSFGTHNTARPAEKTFTIQNNGTDDLVITSITVTGSVFSITGSPFRTPVAPGGTTTFTITGIPPSIGTFQETITISNNDSNEGSYQFNVKIIGEENFFDSDGDGVLDNIDIDDDNDGILDIDEENACKNSSISISANYKFLNETFGAGNRTTINTTYGFASTNYCYEDGSSGSDTVDCPTLSDYSLNDGEYTVGSSPQIASWASGYWVSEGDHTGDPNGRMAMFNADYAPGLFYSAAIKGALPNVPITYSFWVMNLDFNGGRLLPDIRVVFRDVNGNDLQEVFANNIPISANGAPDNWHQYTADLLLNVDEFYVYFYNNETGGLGNDLAIDDIIISQTLCDTDNDGVADVFDLDSDNDGIPDVVEAGLGDYSEGTATLTNIASWVDNNENGMHDLIEGHIALDSDGDGTPNFLDLDSDNDAIFDVDESGAGNSGDGNYQNGDGDISGNGVGQGTDTDVFRETDVDSDNVLEYFPDGILDVYDYFNGDSYSTAYGNQNQGLGNTFYVQDTDGDGTPDYIDTTSNGTTFDISHTLYASLDGNNNGVIDDTNDAEGDGILDLFDTDDAAFGSPRDLDRKLQLYFDGRNDYGEDVNVISSGSATIMSFIKLDGTNNLGNIRVVAGQNDFYLRINSDNTVSTVVEGTVLTSSTAIINGIWTHIAATTTSGKTVLYINGVEEGSYTSGGITDASNFTIGRDSSGSNYFKGYIDELRVFDKAISANELQKIIYQEIQDNGGSLRGAIIPRNVTDYIDTTTAPIILPWANLKRYFRMDAYKDDIIDDYTTLPIDISTGARIYNMKIIEVQTAPLPFVTQIGDTTLPNAVDISADGVLGTDAITYDWSIVKIEHKNITYNNNQKHLGLIVNNQDASSNPIEFSIQNDSELNISWYLELDGFIDLDGESQLVQGDESILDEDSGGYIERDQQGTGNSFNYNYWSSSVGITSGSTAARGTGIASTNSAFSVKNQLFDGRNAVAPAPITDFNISPYYADAAPTGALKVSSYWLWKFNGAHDIYDAWIKIDENTSLLPGEGYTMKGSLGNVALTTDQNYTFRGKPHNGDFTLPITTGTDRLIGNPYPSAMDADEFIKDNIKETINGKVGRNSNNIFNGALYFWHHFGEENSHILREYVGGYATYTLIGGTEAISNDTRINNNDALGGKIPERYIPVNQGFFVNAYLDSNIPLETTGTIDGGDIVFKNSQRVFKREGTNGGYGSLFFKSNLKSKNKTSQNTKEEKEEDVKDQRLKIHLMFDSPSGYHRKLLVGVDENASNKFDIGYDGPIADLAKDDMFWVIEGGKFVIQGVHNFNLDQELPLGLKISEAGLISIKIEELENIDNSLEFYIKDNIVDKTYKINENPFEVNLDVGEYLDRFSLVFKPKLLTLKEVTLIKGIQTCMNNSICELQIKKIVDTKINQINLYNYLGQLINNWETNLNEQIITLPIKASTGIYIVQIITSDGAINKK